MAITADRVDRARPPFVRQADVNWCWAATLEAWTRVDGRWGGLKSQRDWVADPGLQPYLHPQTKAINIQAGIPYLRVRFHLVQEAWNTGVAGIGAPQLSQLRAQRSDKRAVNFYLVNLVSLEIAVR